jgi:hypothetical protein
MFFSIYMFISWGRLGSTEVISRTAPPVLHSLVIVLPLFPPAFSPSPLVAQKFSERSNRSGQPAGGGSRPPPPGVAVHADLKSSFPRRVTPLPEHIHPTSRARTLERFSVHTLFNVSITASQSIPRDSSLVADPHGLAIRRTLNKKTKHLLNRPAKCRM